jgi:RHS repeat-associated protein
MPTTYYYTVDSEIIGEHTAGQSRIDYLTDALGSVVATVDQSQSVTSTARYKPFGDDLAVTGTGPVFGWNGMSGYRRTGRPHAQEYIRNRTLATTDGRWTTVDPLWPEEGAYSYVNLNPSTFTDPSGYSLCSNDPCEYCRGKDRHGRDRDHGIPPWASKYRKVIEEALNKYCRKTCPNLTANMIVCQIKAESDGNAHEHTRGAQDNWGIMQLSIDNWCSEFGPFKPNVFDTTKSIMCGVKNLCGAARCNMSKYGTHTDRNTPYDCCIRC